MTYVVKNLVKSLMVIEFLFSRWRLFSFLNFIKTWPSLTKTILREAWPWHSRSKIRKITGKSILKFCRLTNFYKFVKLFTNFLKHKRNRKTWKVLSLWKVDWHNLLEQFPHISTTNFAMLFSSENLKEKTTIFKNCNFFCQAYFLHSGNQVFANHAHTTYLYIK